MAKKALIHGTRICQIVEDGEEFSVAPELKWVDVADDTTERDTYVDGAVVKYAAPALTTKQKIEQLEMAVSNRRIRDALASDEGKKWMSDIEAEIAKERAKL